MGLQTGRVAPKKTQRGTERGPHFWFFVPSKNGRENKRRQENTMIGSITPKHNCSIAEEDKNQKKWERKPWSFKDNVWQKKEMDLDWGTCGMILLLPQTRICTVRGLQESMIRQAPGALYIFPCFTVETPWQEPKSGCWMATPRKISTTVKAYICVCMYVDICIIMSTYMYIHTYTHALIYT